MKTARIFNVSVETHRHTTGSFSVSVYGVMPSSKRAERLNSSLFQTFGRDPEAIGSFISSFEEDGKEYKILNIALWSVSEIVKFKRACRKVGVTRLDDGDGIMWRHTAERQHTPVDYYDEW